MMSPDAARGRRRRWQALQTCGAVGLVATAVLAPVPTGSQEQLWWSLAAAAALVASAVCLLGASRRDRVPREPVALVLVGAVALLMFLQMVPLPRGAVAALSPRRAALGLASAEALGAPAPARMGLTASSKETRDALLLFGAYAFSFVAASYVFRPTRALRSLFGALAVAGAAMGAGGFFALVAAGGAGRLSSTYTNPNRFASLMGMCMLAAAGWRMMAARAGRRREVTVATVAACATGLSLILTLSRTGIASMALTVLGLAFLATTLGESRVEADPRRTRRFLVVGASVTGSVLLASLLASFDPVWERYSVLFDGELGGGRLECWKLAAGIVADFPVFGSGAGSFQHVFPLYQKAERLAGFYKYAHNDYLNLLTDMGVVGFGLVAAAAILWYRAVARGLRGPSAARKISAWVGIGAVTFVALHSAADFVLKQPANALVFAVVAGAVLGHAGSARSPGSPRRRRHVPLVMAGVACFLATRLPSLAYAGAAGGPVRTSEDARARSLRLQAAARLDPRDLDMRREAASLVAQAAPEDDDAKASRMRAIALEVLRGAPGDHETLDARSVYLAGVLRWRSGDGAGGDAAMRTAASFAPAYPDITRNVGTYFVRRWVESRGAEPALLDDAVVNLARACALRAVAGELRQSLQMLEAVPLGSARLDEIVPDEEWAVRLLADHHARSGRPGEAVRVIRAYARRAAAPGAALLGALATYQDQAGLDEDALQARIAAVLATSPGARAAAAGAIVRELVAARRPGDAAMFVRALRRRAPRETAGMRAEAEFALASDDLPRAYRLLRETATQTGADADYFRLAHIALRLGRPAEAEELVSRAIDAGRHVAAYWCFRADLRAAAGQTALAIQDLQTALHASGDDMAVRTKLAALLAEAKRVEALVALWREAAARRPDDASVQEHLARALFAAAEFDEAVAHARRSLELDPSRASTRALLREIDPDGPAGAGGDPPR